MADVTADEFATAAERGRKRLTGPRAESAHHDRERDRIVVRLQTGVEICFGPQTAEGLQNASADDLAVIEVEPFGLGIHFPRLDADFYIPSLVRGVTGSKRWMAAGRRPSTTETASARSTIRRERRPLRHE